ncbi:MAG: ABC transporter ATP-binding protein, partial [Dehalococcoidales bacterium]|nr:ABC transporter ATP-binding protein [Dehalococcoidales bacterium]
MLEVDNLKFYYSRENEIIKNISFSLNEHDVLCLLGPNGTGKTTLLRCLLALNKPKSGNIYVDGTDITKTGTRKMAKYLAYVPQASSMAFPYDAEEIVLMGRIAHLGLGAGPTQKDREICREAMETLGISHLRSKLFNKMSGGERQMVLVARAMAQQARIMVMDEPTANLDYCNQVKILQVISRLSEQGYSILMTTHFPDHAFLACSRVMLMRDGFIIACGTPDKVVTSDSLSDLYQTHVCVTEATLYPNNTR